MSPLERRVLERMRQLLNGGWTREVFARNEDGGEVSALDERAVSFCLLGATLRAQEDLHVQCGGKERLATLLFRDPYFNIPEWNDALKRTKEDVLAKLDHALDANV